LKARGLDGVKLVISDAHTGVKAAIARVVEATWQRCRVHWMRNALAHVPKGLHTVVAAAIRQAFTQPDRDSAGQTWRHVADQLRPRWPKLATLMDDGEADVLAYMTFPGQHRTKLHSTNPLERLNKEVSAGPTSSESSPTRTASSASSAPSSSSRMTRGSDSTATCRSRPSAQIDAAQPDPLLSITTQAA
jgi:putative transposase